MKLVLDVALKKVYHQMYGVEMSDRKVLVSHSKV